MATRLQESSFHILLLGDFSGRANRGLCEHGSNLASRRPLQVDRDNGGDVLDGMGVQLTRIVAAGGREPVAIRFSTLDDFHPDRLNETVGLFSWLRSLSSATTGRINLFGRGGGGHRLGKVFKFGMNDRIAQGGELTDLPLFTEQENGETRLDLCSELLLNERETEHLRRRGITPILSIQGRDAIRIPTLQSIRGDVLEAD